MNKLLLLLTLFVAALLLTNAAMANQSKIQNNQLSGKDNIKVSVPDKYNHDHSGSCLNDYKKALNDWTQYKKDNKKQGSSCDKNALTCEQALASGLLTGSINGNKASITNNAGKDFKVSFASYNMYAALIDDQTLFDSTTKNVGAGKTTQLNIDVPSCGYQVDLVCGDVIKNAAPYYNIASMIDTGFVNQNNYCTQTDSSSNKKYSASLTIASGFPQGHNYVFNCNAKGFTATSYNWYFGDGQIQVATPSNNVYHTYVSTGQYTVACRSADGTKYAVDTLAINVN